MGNTARDLHILYLDTRAIDTGIEEAADQSSLPLCIDPFCHRNSRHLPSTIYSRRSYTSRAKAVQMQYSTNCLVLSQS